MARLGVVTGDHGLADDYKPGGGYSAYDLGYDAAMREAVRGLEGDGVEFLNDHARLIPRLLEAPPDLVLNLCDTGYRNVAARELHVPALLEMLDIPYTGAPPAAMALCCDKALVRSAAAALDVAVPAELYVAPDQAPAALDDFSYPALVKPNAADGSLGITREAVVAGPDEARRYLAVLRRRLPGAAALVQEFLPGTEYGLGLIGNPGTGFTVLPPLEVDYGGLPAGLPAIMGYESKTDPASPYWTGIRFRRAGLTDAEVQRLAAGAKRLFARLQCRDYARFDFRTAAGGTIKLMEVNPNPAWDHEAKLALMAGFAGHSYAGMFALILAAARARLAGG